MGEPITQKHLKKYLGWKMRVVRCKELIARAKSEECFPAMRENVGSQHQPGSGDQMERSVIRRMEIEEKLLPIIEENERNMAQIEQAINSLDDPYEQEVLTCRYLDGEWVEDEQRSSYDLMPWAAVAMCIHKNDDEKYVKSVTRAHGQALKSISEFTFE